MGNEIAFRTAPKDYTPRAVRNSGVIQTTPGSLPGAENRNTLENRQPGNKAPGFSADA